MNELDIVVWIHYSEMNVQGTKTPKKKKEEEEEKPRGQPKIKKNENKRRKEAEGGQPGGYLS